MEHRVKLKDGTEVVIRELTLDDLEQSVEFFQALPKEDRSTCGWMLPNRRMSSKESRG